MTESGEQVVIEKIVQGGAGLARADGMVILVPGVLPGETVRVRRGEARHGVTRGELAGVIHQSPRRVKPSCPLFLSCGGCGFLHTDYANELELKQQVLAETLERVGKLKPRILPPVPALAPEGYRAFVQLKIDAAGKIGLFRRDSHDVVPFEGAGFEGCRLQRPRLNCAVEMLQGRLAGYQVVKFREGDVGFVVNLTAESPLPPNPALFDSLRDLKVTGLLVNDRPVFGSPEVLYIYGEAPGSIYRFRVSHDAFFQPDPSVVQRLADRVAEIITAETGDNRLNENLLDLYAGVGTFGIQLARKMLGVYCVEIGESAVRDLEQNVSENHVTNVAPYRGTAKSFLKRFRGTAGAIIVDPPRAGIEVEVRRAIEKLSAPLLCYVSCHPATLARDLADLVMAGGYEIDSVQLFDQFGRTHHIESLSVLKKIPAAQT